MDKRTDLTGGDNAKLVQLIRKLGHNVDVDIQLGTISSPPPAIALVLDNDGMELTASDLIVAHHLTEHTRNITLAGVDATALTIHGGLANGDRVLVACMDAKMQYVVLDKAVTY
ncbi:DUF2577 family protein [uncultured Planococcus sp.]|uniref:DUF2577 family protein n=1 Tax=uncultured Planococcus sp. TaxID=337815 RepID=UPI00262465C9|nr:DUF2577 family protein [uncultured Planococcus sp.]